MGKSTAGVAALATKIGTKLLPIALKLAKVAKIGKILLAVGSMAIYTYLFTWQFSVLILISLFIHENGHIFAMKRCGLKTKGIYFIPFLGAAAVSDDMFKSRRDEVYIAAMGPIWGFTLAVITASIYLVTKNALFAAASGWMALVNLFNLLPVHPLDGGRIMKSITFSINSRLGLAFLITGIIISIFITFWAGIFLFFVLTIIGSLEFLFEYRYRNPNRAIKKSIKFIDDCFSNTVGHPLHNAAIEIRNILSNKKEEPWVRIKKVMELENSDDTNRRVTSSILCARLQYCDLVPKMSRVGTVLSVLVYVAIVGILWMLMTWMNHIPEVEMARKIFMS